MVKHENSYCPFYPFGSFQPGRNHNAGDYRFGFNGQEMDNEVSGTGNTNTAMFWEYDTRLGRRWNLDPKPQISISDYACFRNNPILFTDINGDSVWVFARSIADDPTKIATHTFIKVKDADGIIKVYAYGPDQTDGKESIIGGSQLKRVYYNEDLDLAEGKNDKYKKTSFYIALPEGMTDGQFTWQAQAAAENSGNHPGIKYNVLTNSETTGNCNSSTSTILWRAGVSKERLAIYGIIIPGADWGWGEIKP